MYIIQCINFLLDMHHIKSIFYQLKNNNFCTIFLDIWFENNFQIAIFQHIDKKMNIFFMNILFLIIYFISILLEIKGNKTAKLHLKIRETNNISINGILKINFSYANESFFVNYQNMNQTLNNYLCSATGYDDIHSIGYPCKIHSTQQIFYTILPLVSTKKNCYKLYINFLFFQFKT